MKILKERFDVLLTFKGLKVVDVRHAIEEFERWFPNLSKNTLKSSIVQGLSKISLEYGNNMFISKKYGFRIPVEIRQDLKNPNKNIIVIPTILNSKETKNLRKELEVMVEQNVFDSRKITEGFNYYISNKEIFTDFDEVEVDWCERNYNKTDAWKYLVDNFSKRLGITACITRESRGENKWLKN